MERSDAERLYAACEQTLDGLLAAEEAVRTLPEGDEKTKLLRALADVFARVYGSVRAPAVVQYPDLEPPETLGEPDSDLDDEDRLMVARLSPADVHAIDHALIADCATSWRKVARVVGTAMLQLRERFPGIPDRYYALRVAALVAAGALEAQGNLDYMRFSEVKLAGGGEA